MATSQKSTSARIEREPDVLASYSQPKRWGWLWMVVSLSIPLCLAAWRVRFGVDLTDEGFYVVPPLRYALGDLPYRDEWWTPLTGFDLLLWPVFEMWPNVGLYPLRLLGLGLFGAGMIPVIWWMGRRIGYASAAIAAGLCIWAGASPLTLPTPSYNRIPEALLPAAMALALIGSIFSSARRNWMLGVAAGVVHGVAAVAYRPCLGLVMFPGTVFAFGLIRRNCSSSFWRVAAGWLVGISIVAFAFIAFLAAYNLWDDYVNALAFNSHVWPSFFGTLPERWDRFYREIPPALPFFLTFAIGFSILTVFVTWAADRWNSPRQHWHVLQSALLAVAIVAGIWLFVTNLTPFNVRGTRYHYQSVVFWMGLSLYAAYKACPIRTLGRWEWPRWREAELFFWFAVAAAAAHGFLSGNGFLATKSFATPIMISAVGCWLYRGFEAHRIGAGAVAFSLGGISWGVALIVCLLSWLQGFQNVKRDEPVVELTTEAPFSVLRGLYTTPKRAEQWKQLEDVLGSRMVPGERLIVYGSSPMINYLSHTRPGLPYSWDYLAARAYGTAWLKSLTDKPRYAVTTMLHPETHGRVERPGRTLSFSYGVGGDPLHSFVRENYCPAAAPYPFILWVRKDLSEVKDVTDFRQLFHRKVKVGSIAPAHAMCFTEWTFTLDSSEPRGLCQRGLFKIVNQGDSASVSYAGGDDTPVLMWGIGYNFPKEHGSMPVSIGVTELDLSSFSGEVKLFFQDRVGKRWQRVEHPLTVGKYLDYSGLDAIVRPDAERASAGIVLRPTKPGDTVLLEELELTIGFWCFAGNELKEDTEKNTP